MWPFAKGHGTLNDFVLLTDEHDQLQPTAAEVRYLCDRRAGIGGDGLLRAVRAGRMPEWTGDPDLWFMDYRNADGSIAEMCGNGLRVFSRYLREEGLVEDDQLEVGTRAGLRRADLLDDGRVRVSMGPVGLDPQPVSVTTNNRTFEALPVEVGNPHAVVILEPGELDELDLTQAPSWAPADRFPSGVNVEFVEPLGPRRARLRVFERGVGETASCGTGTVAAAGVLARLGGWNGGAFEVEVRGGDLLVELDAGQGTLTGPAVIVARGTLAVRD